jgi:hypothetical protein
LWYGITDSFEGPSAMTFCPEDGKRERERQRERGLLRNIAAYIPKYTVSSQKAVTFLIQGC